MKKNEILILAGVLIATIALNLWMHMQLQKKFNEIASTHAQEVRELKNLLDRQNSAVDEQATTVTMLSTDLSSLTQTMAAIDAEAEKLDDKVRSEAIERKKLSQKLESQMKNTKETLKVLAMISRDLDESTKKRQQQLAAQAERQRRHAAQIEREAQPIKAKIAKLEKLQEETLKRLKIVMESPISTGNSGNTFADASATKKSAERKRKSMDDLRAALLPIQRVLEVEYARLEALYER